MTDRDKLFQQFGPYLTETLLYLLLTEINILRQNQGMPEITEEELLALALNHITQLHPYDWMGED